jgi:uncharacterized membrane protein
MKKKKLITPSIYRSIEPKSGFLRNYLGKYFQSGDEIDHEKLRVILFLVIFTIVSCLQYTADYYGFMIYSGDYCNVEQSLWNVLQGNSMVNTFEKGNHLGAHFSPILYLFVPLFWIFPSLLCVTFACIVFFALALYWFYTYSREKQAPAAGLFVIVMLAFHNTMTSSIGGLFRDPSVQSFRELALLPLPFVGLIHFYKKEKLWAFLLCALVTLCIRESLYILIFSWGVIAAFQKRKLPWILVPMGVAVIYFILVPNFLMKWLNPSGYIPVWTFFKEYGSTPREIIINLLFNPSLVIKTLFSSGKYHYLFQLLMPFLFVLPFFRYWWLPGLVPLLYILLSTNGRIDEPGYHYSIEIVLWLAFSTLVILIDKYNYLSRLKINIFSKLVTIFIIFLLIVGIILELDRLNGNITSLRYRSFRDVVEQLPEEAGVVTHRYLANHLAKRPLIRFIDGIKIEDLLISDVRYLLLESSQVIKDTTYLTLVKKSGTFQLYEIKEASN